MFIAFENSVHVPTTYQIKYLRVPEKLLDDVKEEQRHARETGRGQRGGGGGGGRGARGGPARGELYFLPSSYTDSFDANRLSLTRIYYYRWSWGRSRSSSARRRAWTRAGNVT